MLKLPTNCLIQFPTGKWGYVGRVDVRLMFTAPDGGTPDPAEVDNARRFGPALAKVKTRTWDTEAEAIVSAEKLLKGS